MLNKVYWNNSVGPVLSIEIQSQGNQQGFCLSNLLPIKAQEIKISQTIKTQLLKQRAIKSLRNKRLWMSTYQPHLLTHMEAEVQRGTKSQSHSRSHRLMLQKDRVFVSPLYPSQHQAGSCPQESIGWWMDCWLRDDDQPALLVVRLRGFLSRTQPQVIDLVLSYDKTDAVSLERTAVFYQVEYVSLRYIMTWPIWLISHLWNGANNRSTLFFVVKLK